MKEVFSQEGKRSVLVVDNEESICLLYEAELEEMGYRVRTQNDGTRVLEDVEALHPDLVVLDVKMPGTNGLELLERLKDKFPGVSVVLNSAYDYLENEPSVQKADGYVVKSSNLTQLLKTIERLLA